MTATIPPGATARVSTKPRSAFQPERLVVSPHSFPLSLARRVWTWPLIVIGHVLGRVHRRLAKLLRVDLLAAHERREYVSVEYAREHPEEVVSWEYASWDQDEQTEDESEERPFILVSTPLNRRERLLAPSVEWRVNSPSSASVGSKRNWPAWSCATSRSQNSRPQRKSPRVPAHDGPHRNQRRQSR